MFYLLNSITFFISFLPLVLCVSNSTERRSRSDATHKNEDIFGINIAPPPPPPSKIDMYVNDWVRNILLVDGIEHPGDVKNNTSFPPVSKDQYYVGMQWMIKKYCFNMSSSKACMQVVLKPQVHEEIPLKFRLFSTNADSDPEIEEFDEKNFQKALGYGTRKNKRKYSNKDYKNYKSLNAFDQFYKHLKERKHKLQHSSKNSENGSPTKIFSDNSSFVALDDTFTKIRPNINTTVEVNNNLEEKENGESVTKPGEEEENEIKERIKRAAKSSRKSSPKKSSHKKVNSHKKKKTKATTPTADDDYYDDEEEDGDEDDYEEDEDNDDEEEEDDYDYDEDDDYDEEDLSGKEESEAHDDYIAVGTSAYGKVFIQRSNDSSADDSSEHHSPEDNDYPHNRAINYLGAYDVAHDFADHEKYADETFAGVQDWNRCQLPPPRKTSEVLCKVLPTKMVCKMYCIHGYTFREGISRETVCELRKGAWSKKFDECLPFVDCTLKLRTAGFLKCTTNTVKTAPRCQVECQRYAKKARSGKRTYQCDATGRWDPPLPHCVEREGIDVVDPPLSMSHLSVDYP